MFNEPNHQKNICVRKIFKFEKIELKNIWEKYLKIQIFSIVFSDFV